MTSSIRPAGSGLRSLVAVAAVGAVALSTYLAPIATAATTVDPDGTVTVTADPAPPAPAEPAARPRRRRHGHHDGAGTSDHEPRTTTPGRRPQHDSATTPDDAEAVGLLHRDARPHRGDSSRHASLDDPTSAKVEWAGVACATRYNVSVFVDGKDSVDVVPAPETSYSLSSLDPTKTYRIQVSSRNDAGQGASSSIFYLRPATPGSVSAMKVTYSDVKGAVLSLEGARSHHSAELPAQGHSCGRPEAGHRRRGGRRSHRVRTRRPRRPRHVRHHPPADQQGR